MNRFAHLSVALFALAGCAHPRHMVLQPGESGPLEISILPPSSGYGIWVNQPAYVALFDVLPGSGVALLYPRVSSDLTRMVRAGSSFVPRGLSFRPRNYFAISRLEQAHYLVAVASRRPLNIRQAAGYSDWITYKLGMASFAGTSLEVVNALFQEVVPVQPADDWATAVYVVYPNVKWRENIYQFVRCQDGFIYVVNVELPMFSCPRPNADDRVPTNDEGGRRQLPDRPEKARAGAAIARGIQGNDLSVLRPMTDVLYRPPAPSAYQPQHSNGSGSASYSRSASESGYSRPASDPGSSQASTPQPAQSTPAQSHAEGGAKPAKQGGGDPKDP